MVCTIYKSPLQQLEYSAQENANLKHSVDPPVPTPVADPEQTAGSEQIRVATIALHTEQEKARNLQEAHVSQRRILSFLAG